MGEVASTDELTIRALVDRGGNYSSDGVLGLDPWEGAKVLDIADGGAQVVDDMGETNTGDPAVLAAFLADGIRAHPAENYALVISDHGASWPGVGGDESADNDMLDLAEIRTAIADGLADAGIDKLDLLGFDACLMATYEVASSVAPLADRLVASAELEPGHGWDYRSLQVLADDPSTSADDLGAALIDSYREQAVAEGTDAEITLSLLDLGAVPALDDAVAEFGAELADGGVEVAPTVGREQADVLAFGRSPDPVENTHMVDLGLFAQGIGEQAPELEPATAALGEALGAVVRGTVDGASTRGATGLSIYFPAQQAFYDPAYRTVERATGWADFLESYYAFGQTIPVDAQPGFDPGTLQTLFGADGVSVVGELDPEGGLDLTEATIGYGLLSDDGSVVYFGEEPALVPEPGTVAGTYDLTTLQISDGIDTVDAYVSLTAPEGSEVFTIDVPMAYYAEGDQQGETYQDALLTLTVDAMTGDIRNETYYSYDPQAGTYGELAADPAGIIVPELRTLAADGTQEWTPTSDVGLYADLPNLSYDLVPLPSGTELVLDLTAYDFGGNSDTLSTQVTVP